jgi:hypothetical protein
VNEFHKALIKLPLIILQLFRQFGLVSLANTPFAPSMPQMPSLNVQDKAVQGDLPAAALGKPCYLSYMETCNLISPPVMF